MSNPPINLSEAVAHSFKNRDEIIASESCACFYCFKHFTPSEILKWTDSEDPNWGDDIEPDLERYPGQTATCPYCKVDSVIGSASGLPLTKDVLESLHAYWYNSTPKMPNQPLE